MKKGMTIRELAKLGGCSPMTVSLALRNHPRISEKIRGKIQCLAQKHGYVRDPVVSTLMNRLRVSRGARAVDTLGVLTWWDTPNGERSNIFGRQSHSGICQRAKSLGYEVDFFWAREPGMTARRLTQILRARSIRGLILTTMPRARGHVSLDWSHFAGATLGYSILKPALHRATYSHYQGMIIALRSLKIRGYKRIGFANLILQEDMANDAWLSAYLGYHFRTEGKINITPLLLPSWSKAKVRAWLQKYEPDVVVSNDTDLLDFMKEAGCRIPEKMGFASLDCAGSIYSGVAQPRERIAEKAVDLVVEQLENNEFGLPKVPKIVMVQGFWQDGPTALAARK
jgi:LacI family transcriptional regulator